MTNNNFKSLFFCGIGGSGMSALADILQQRGVAVSGSDRGRDQGQAADKFTALERRGIKLFPQDGSGITPDISAIVVSSAIEETVPDIQAGRRFNLPILKRAEILAGLFNDTRGIAIGGTSGKTTVTGMAGHLLWCAGLSPTIINGGVMVNFMGQSNSLLGNAVAGAVGAPMVIETDESDGTIALYNPAFAVLNNITLDHKPVADLRPLFHNFLTRAREGVAVNLDDPESAMMATLHSRTITFSTQNNSADIWATNIVPRGMGTAFTIKDSGREIILNVPGRHNVSNALAALAVARHMDISEDVAARALATFAGIRRRLDLVGVAAGITVIDDFAHNPDKIAASLAALRSVVEGRLVVVFQPHGFGPMNMMRREIVEAFSTGLSDRDIVIFSDVFYAGGTTVRVVDSPDLVKDIAVRGCNALHIPTRPEIRAFLNVEASHGDTIVIMGARDDTLSSFAQDILQDISGR